MIYERAMELVAALRSGKYTQTTRRLKKDGGFCCLGVACDISGLGEWVILHMDHSEGSKTELSYQIHQATIESNEFALLPRAVKEHFGFKTNSGILPSGSLPNTKELSGLNDAGLSGLNDAGLTFEQIADIIVVNWKEL